ncbi:MAG TPA: aspartate kinase [Armatimonadota bacterium]|jgi:aspartate kinase
MKIIVQKFGGTSVSTPENRELAAAKVIQAREAGYAPVVVVSAMGRRGQPYATDTLIDELKAVDPSTRPENYEYDALVAVGEIISTTIFSQLLRSKGYAARSMTGWQAGIITEDRHADARIKAVRTQHLLAAIEDGIIPVVAGFQGVTEPRDSRHTPEVTTLGRGGSDTSGAALGAALKAEAVEIYTDVNGVKTADPSLVKDAVTLDQVTYVEIAEMAHLGAKVLHPRAAEIGMDYNVPLWVKSTFTDERGTLITHCERPVAWPRITGVAHSGKVVYFNLSVEDPQDKAKIELELYRLFAQAKVNIYLISASPKSVGFAVERPLLPRVQEMLQGLMIPVPRGTDGHLRWYILSLGESAGMQGQRMLLEKHQDQIDLHVAEATMTENCSVVSLISGSIFQTPGVLAEVAEVLAGVGVEIYQIADSQYSLSLLVLESDVQGAVRALHAHFVGERPA